MCGRYTVSTEDEVIEMREIIKEISIRISREDMALYGKEAYPGAVAPVITQNKEIKRAKFGMEKWDGRGLIFNARSEGIIESKFFRGCLQNGRCVALANNYFEWQREGSKILGKYKIFARDESPLYLASVMRQDSGGEYAVITREAAENIRFIHPRMPLILSEDMLDAWLAPQIDERIICGKSVDVAFERVG